jgi:hypothetical protein
MTTSVPTDDSGFAIMLRNDIVVARYEATVLRPEDRVFYDSLRSVLAPHDPSHYRGFSRTPLEAPATSDAAPLDALGGAQLEPRATHRFREILSSLPDEAETAHLLPSFDLALEVYARLDSPDHYEIVHLSRKELSSNQSTLGFDVGYWGGDHFSILADAAVVPTWHPPDPDSFLILRDALGTLNASFLFPSAEAARMYRAFYLTQAWAESEFYSGEFVIVRVSAF